MNKRRSGKVTPPESVLEPTENVVLVKEQTKPICHKFFKYFGDDAQQSNGAIVRNVLMVTFLGHRDNDSCF